MVKVRTLIGHELPMHEVGNRIGKVVAGSVYVHRDALSYLSDEEQRAVRNASRIAEKWGHMNHFNVVKIAGGMYERVTFLVYEAFEVKGIPALLECETVNLTEGSVRLRDYRQSKNPPVLHRKELLLAPEDPRREAYGRLTKELERIGLLGSGRNIGFKEQWERALDDAGVRIDEQRVIAVEAE